MPITWVLPSKLARSSRPGYQGERGAPVSQETVDQWIEEALSRGVKSVICLLHDDQLDLYAALPERLPTYYEQKSLVVAHIPAMDHQSPPLTDVHLDQIWSAYQRLPKPVLIHCSAGLDRTGRAIEHIKACLSE